jgi:hypothetical protein
VRSVLRLCEFYPGISLITGEKARKNLNQSKKNLSQVKKNLSHSTVYILPKHPHITKPLQTHTLQNPLIHTLTKQYKTTTVQIMVIMHGKIPVAACTDLLMMNNYLFETCRG